MFSSLYWSCSTGWSPELCQVLEQNAKLLSTVHLSRARDYSLYLAPHKKQEAPKRICDLYLNGGQALQGHRPAGIRSHLKNLMSRGLYGAFPSERAEQRLRLLLTRLFPNLQDFRVYHSIYALHGILPSVADFLRDRQGILLGGEQVQLWRPLAAEQPNTNAAYCIPVLAFSSLPLLVLDLKITENTENTGKMGADTRSASLPPSDICSPLELEALVQALAQTEKLLSPSNNLHKNYSALADLCHSFSQRRQGRQNWLEDGIYLYWNSAGQSMSTYARLWQAFLEAGFLLPPNPLAPLILSPTLLRNAEEASASASALSSEGKCLRVLLEDSALL